MVKLFCIFFPLCNKKLPDFKFQSQRSNFNRILLYISFSFFSRLRIIQKEFSAQSAQVSNYKKRYIVCFISVDQRQFARLVDCNIIAHCLLPFLHKITIVLIINGKHNSYIQPQTTKFEPPNFVIF